MPVVLRRRERTNACLRQLPPASGRGFEIIEDDVTDDFPIFAAELFFCPEEIEQSPLLLIGVVSAMMPPTKLASVAFATPVVSS